MKGAVPLSSVWQSSRAPTARSSSPSVSSTSCHGSQSSGSAAPLDPVSETILEQLEEDVLYEDDGETALLLADRPSSESPAGTSPGTLPD